MSRTENENLKTLYVAKVLIEETGEDVYLTPQRIADKVNGIAENEHLQFHASAKSVASDVKALKKFLNISEHRKGNETCYSVSGRKLDKAELAFLYAAIADSHFLTEAQSEELLGKLSIHAPKSELQEIRSALQPIVPPKSRSSLTLINTDRIIDAIGAKCKVNFLYEKFYFDKGGYADALDGKVYEITPLCLHYSRSDCYMIGWWDGIDNTLCFRVDRMHDVQVRRDLPATKNPKAREFDEGKFDEETFGMYSSEDGSVLVKFLIAQDAANSFLDRFDVDPERLARSFKDGYGSSAVRVQPSPSFFSWVSCFGNQLRIASPPKVVDQYRQFLLDALSATDSKTPRCEGA